MDETTVGNVLRFLRDKHLSSVPQDWIREKIAALSDEQKRDASNVIYKQILECDWKSIDVKLSDLPPGLNLQLLNETKRTFNGNYVLQISGIVDISRSFTENKFDAEEDEDEDDEDNVSDNELAKLMKGKKASAKKTEKRSWTNGKRCLELALFDGKTECLAMEYWSVPCLHDNLLGAKILLKGPFDVYAGIIFLQPKNVELLSDVTFYPPVEKSAQQTPAQINNQNQISNSTPNSTSNHVPNNISNANTNRQNALDDIDFDEDIFSDITV